MNRTTPLPHRFVLYLNFLSCNYYSEFDHIVPVVQTFFAFRMYEHFPFVLSLSLFLFLSLFTFTFCFQFHNLEESGSSWCIAFETISHQQHIIFTLCAYLHKKAQICKNRNRNTGCVHGANQLQFRLFHSHHSLSPKTLFGTYPDFQKCRDKGLAHLMK